MRRCAMPTRAAISIWQPRSCAAWARRVLLRAFTRRILVRTKYQVVRPGERLLNAETRLMWDQITRLAGLENAVVAAHAAT
jgi:hypothetical protein